MTKLEISNQAAEKLKEVSEKAQKSIDELILWLLDNYADAIISDEQSAVEDDDVTWTDEEISELIQPQSLTGKEIVEGGFVGGWEHKNIDDPVAFLKQQRANHRKNKFSW